MKHLGIVCVLLWALVGVSATAWSCDGAATSPTYKAASDTQQPDSLSTPAPTKPDALTCKRAIVDGDRQPMTLLFAIIRSPKSSEIIQAPRERPARRHRVDPFSAAWRI
jgi:hypothetical protein